MIDIRLIRENPEQFRQHMATKNIDAPIEEILELDATRRSLIGQVEDLKAQRNEGSKQVGRTRDDGERDRLIAAMKDIGDTISDLDEQVREPDRAHLLGQPFPQLVEPRLGRVVQGLGGVCGQVPAVLIRPRIAVVRRRLEEEVVGRVQPLRQIVGNVLGVSG